MPETSVFKKIWMAIGLLLYIAIAIILPITVPLMGVFSDAPETWVRLLIPLIMIPFLMGYAQPLFLMPWKIQLWTPGALYLMIAITSVVDSVRTHTFLIQDLIFWPLMIAAYLAMSYAGLRVRNAIQVTRTGRS